nr:MAG TPA: hypothetical protein [Caudoviricetes sp.]
MRSPLHGCVYLRFTQHNSCSSSHLSNRSTSAHLSIASQSSIHKYPCFVSAVLAGISQPEHRIPSSLS